MCENFCPGHLLYHSYLLLATRLLNHLLFPSGSQGAGTYPSIQWAEVCQSMTGQTHKHTHSQTFQTDLLDCICLDCGSKLEYPEETCTDTQK